MNKIFKKGICVLTLACGLWLGVSAAQPVGTAPTHSYWDDSAEEEFEQETVSEDDGIDMTGFVATVSGDTVKPPRVVYRDVSVTGE